MEKFTLSIDELMVLMINAQAQMQNRTTCYCHGTTCFNCTTVDLLKKISRKTAIPVNLPELKKREEKTETKTVQQNFMGNGSLSFMGTDEEKLRKET